jgi:hypothetical protein
MHQIFYLTLDPERALGVEDFIPSYHIIYSEGSQLANPIANAGIDIKNFVNSGSNINSTSKLLEHPDVKKYIKSRAHEKPDLLVFKNDEQIEKLAKKNNFKLLNPSYKLGLELENKVNFSKFVDELGFVEQPDYELFEKLSDLDYKSICQKFGNEFIVQFILGHTGSGTFFIDSETTLGTLIEKYPLRKGKVAKKINGIPYTINACITKLGIIIGGISEQITGVEGLTSSKGGTIGNDFTQRHLNDVIRSEMVTITTKIGEILGGKGHKGIFGLDFMLESDTGKLFLIEANIRQVASSTYVSYLQRMNNQVPIMLWHILELLDFAYTQKFDCLDDIAEEWINEGITKFRLSNDKLSLNLANNQPIQASQIIFRNTKDHAVQMLDQFPGGIYRMRGRTPEESSLMENDKKYLAIYKLREDGWSTLCLEARGYNILEAKEYEGFLLNTALEKTIIEPHGEIGRIQFLDSAFSDKGSNNINGWLMDVVNCVYENTRIIKHIR